MQLTIRYVKVGHNKFFGDFKHQVEEIPNEKTIADLAYEDLKIQRCCGLKPFYTSYDESLNKGDVYIINEKEQLWTLLDKARLFLLSSNLNDSKSSKLQNRISSIICAVEKLKTEDE